MINKKLFLKNNKVGFVLGAVVLAALTAGVSNIDGQGVRITVSPPVVVVPPPVVVAPVVVVQDDYVYYPDYAIYYNSHRHQYAYLQGDAWVFAAAPQGVSVDVLLASPSVRMDWHDSPEHHHSEMIQRYPRNWKPSAEHQDRRDAGHDGDKRDRDGH